MTEKNKDSDCLAVTFPASGAGDGAATLCSVGVLADGSSDQLLTEVLRIGTFFQLSASVNSRPAKHQTITFFEGR